MKSITPSQWLFEMREIWLSKKPALMAGLLAEKFEYYESPFSPPLTKVEDVVEAWQEIHQQSIEQVEIKILHETESVAVAQWLFKQKGAPVHVGAYFLRLDESGKCIEFRQWWNG